MARLAYILRSPWALLLGSTARSSFRTVLAYLFLPGRNNRFRWEAEARRELFGFGSWVFVSTLLTIATQSADLLIFGKLLSVETLGVYSLGKHIASAPAEAVSHIGSNVVFP